MTQKRCRRPSDDTQEDTEAGRYNIEEAKRLQSEPAQRKRDQEIECHFLAFTWEESLKSWSYTLLLSVSVSHTHRNTNISGRTVVIDLVGAMASFRALV
ncbi:hypothetical protein DPEC_G00040460 [Dallia pectoralis]|uniref:Uncharacterized protein n=1 Tax=Dallia pectoralis TaxID=75939 RepID=A0ACC2HFH9_DALPE|nr:hypothetical protein DPEC_G00040460 [Dallia pectoralis]